MPVPAARHRQVVDAYTERDWRAANQALRAGTGDGADAVKRLDAAMQPISADATVWRRVPVEVFGGAPLEQLPGYRVRDAAYFPATRERMPAADGVVDLEVAVPAGTPAMATDDRGGLLLGRGLDMSIDAVSRNAAGGFDVRVTVLVDPAAYRGRRRVADETTADRPVPQQTSPPETGTSRLLPSSDDDAAARLNEFRRQMADIFDGEHDGYRTRVTDVEAAAGVMVATGEIVDADGNRVGGFMRGFELGSDGLLVASHLALELDDALQGNGLAHTFNQAAVERYRRLGVDRIKLTANLDVGGYAWARAGYDFAAERDAQRVLDKLRRMAAGIGVARVPEGRRAAQQEAARLMVERAERAGFGSDDFPTPYEISQLGRWSGAGRDDWWAGKAALWGTTWDGVRPL